MLFFLILVLIEVIYDLCDVIVWSLICDGMVMFVDMIDFVICVIGELVCDGGL